jgi:uncharacterized membrane protein YidH (DUF202 family)
VSVEPRSARPFDRGLQPERTALAWRRTGLSLAVGAVVAVRILPEHLGVWAVGPAGLGLLAAVLVLIGSERRYRAQHRILTSADTDRVELPDGTLPALLAASTALGGLVCLFVVMAAAFP